MNWYSARLQHYMLDWHSGLDHFVLLLNTLFNFTDYNLKQDCSQTTVISIAQSCLNLCYPMDCSTPGFQVHHQLPEFTHVIESVMPSKHLIFYSPLLLLPSIFTSIRVSSNESVLCIRSFSFSPSNEYSGLLYFRIDWFDLLAVQGTLKSILQDHSSKASILRCSTFCIVQLSHPYMTTGKTVALTIRTI